MTNCKVARDRILEYQREEKEERLIRKEGSPKRDRVQIERRLRLKLKLSGLKRVINWLKKNKERESKEILTRKCNESKN